MFVVYYCYVYLLYCTLRGRIKGTASALTAIREEECFMDHKALL